MIMMSLKDGKCGVCYKIVGFEEGELLQRFWELGFTVGQKVKIVSMSILKKVFLLEIRGYILSVRASLLSCVKVEA